MPSQDKKCDCNEIHLVMFPFSQCGNMRPQYFILHTGINSPAKFCLFPERAFPFIITLLLPNSILLLRQFLMETLSECYNLVIIKPMNQKQIISATCNCVAHDVVKTKLLKSCVLRGPKYWHYDWLPLVRLFGTLTTRLSQSHKQNWRKH